MENLIVEDKFEVEANSKITQYKFEGCVSVTDNEYYNAQHFSCCICQLIFTNFQMYEDHLLDHSDCTDFKWLKENRFPSEPNFGISYQVCSDPTYLKLTVKKYNEDVDLIIKQIIIIKPISLIILKNPDEIPEDFKDSWSFLTFNNIFNKYRIEPIIIISYKKSSDEKFIEHFFLNSQDLSTCGVNLVDSVEEYPLDNCIRESFNICRNELNLSDNLKMYLPEPELQKLTQKDNFCIDHLLSYSKTFRDYCANNQKITISNATEILRLLLKLEDIQISQIYYKLTQPNATVEWKFNSYVVELKLTPKINLESILKPGDTLKLEAGHIISILAIVQRVCKKTVYFEVLRNSSYVIDKEIRYQINFYPNRANLQYQYAALELIENNDELKKFLFPERDQLINKLSRSIDLKFDFLNKSVETNPEQKNAVANIVNRTEKLIYVIVGPPGTGKTTTIIESILQILLLYPDARILITTGSNAVCDEITKILLKYIESNIQYVKLFRLFAKSHESKLSQIDDQVKKFSNLAYGFQYYPAFDIIENYNIIISTLSVVGRLKASGLPENFFSHCFIDECAASSEVEALIAITAVYHSHINIVVSGDPAQLGPILKSNMAAQYGLENSLMDRLLQLDCYHVDSDRNYNRSIQARLVRNFRSHPYILKIPNKLFYNNDLIASASREKVCWALNWSYLPRKTIPIIFTNVNGKTQKDLFSSSLYNIEEVEIVIKYVKNIIFNGIKGKWIKEEDIGIISPYNKQISLIRNNLKKYNLKNITIGSVEKFQGQEKPIIIISTVRSIYSDGKKGTGFLNSDKRLNVMLTRAQGLLIIVGNIDLLSTMPQWNKLIKYLGAKHICVNKDQFLYLNNTNTSATNYKIICPKNITIQNESKVMERDICNNANSLSQGNEDNFSGTSRFNIVENNGFVLENVFEFCNLNDSSESMVNTSNEVLDLSENFKTMKF